MRKFDHEFDLGDGRKVGIVYHSYTCGLIPDSYDIVIDGRTVDRSIITRNGFKPNEIETYVELYYGETRG